MHTHSAFVGRTRTTHVLIPVPLIDTIHAHPYRFLQLAFFFPRALVLLPRLLTSCLRRRIQAPMSPTTGESPLLLFYLFGKPFLFSPPSTIDAKGYPHLHLRTGHVLQPCT